MNKIDDHIKHITKLENQSFEGWSVDGDVLMRALKFYDERKSK